MRILVDLLSLGFGGSETYPEQILPRFAESPHTFFVLVSKGAGSGLKRRVGGNVVFLESPAWATHWAGRHWFQRSRLPSILQEIRAEAVFVPGGLTGYRHRMPGIRLVTMARNMLPFMREERLRFGWLSYPRIRTRLELLESSLLKTFRLSDRLICVSEHTASVLKPMVDPGKCTVIPHGAPEPAGDRTDEDQILKQHGLRDPYFLYLSLFDPYKHQLEVIEGFLRFTAESGSDEDQLVLAGPIRGAYGRKVRALASSKGDRIVCPGTISRDQLPVLLRRARILLFASTCEACPNILLEYLSAGRPILCSNAAPMPEFGGDAVLYVPPREPQEWANGLLKLAGDAALREEMGNRARRRSGEYSWEKTAKATLDALTSWP